MFYSISGLCPQPRTSGAGFYIKLFPAYRRRMAALKMSDDDCRGIVDSLGREWLDGCGFGKMYDPDNCGRMTDPSAKPGPRASPLYMPNRDLHVTWGDWGVEHITVPGNGCGLDIDTHAAGKPYRGAMLVPHNVDSIRQAHLLLVVFTWFAEYATLERECARAERRYNMGRKVHGKQV